MSTAAQASRRRMLLPATPAPRKDYVRIARTYARRIVAKKIPSSKWTQLACRRHLDDLRRARRSGGWKFYFSPAEAWNACDFIEKLPHVEGQWESPTLVLEPWQAFIVVSIFGWRRRVGPRPHPADPRRFDTAYIEVARKNAKSTLVAGIALYCLTCEGEMGPQVKIAATTNSQARVVFEIAQKMVQRTRDLREAFNVESMAHAIPCWSNGGSIQPIHSKAKTQDGLNPHLTVIDELHAHHNRALFDVLRSAQGARRNPLSFYITTAGHNLVCVCYEQRTYVTKILEGILPGDHYFGIIYTLDEGDSEFDEPAWIKPNPNLNVSVFVDKLRSEALEARSAPGSLNEFKTKRMNLWLNSAGAWLNMVQWDACADPTLTEQQFLGERCWIGADLASKNDVASYCKLFYREGIFHAFWKYYLPKDLVEAAAHRTTAHYVTWARDGLFTLTPGDLIDYDFIERDLKADCERFAVQVVVFDPFQSTQISTHLTDAGIIVHQGSYTVKGMSDPSKELEARIQVKKFRHNGDPVAKWMASNVVVFRDLKGNILPRKENKDSPNKIDGIAALILALERATAPGESPSIYSSDRGLLTL